MTEMKQVQERRSRPTFWALALIFVSALTVLIPLVGAAYSVVSGYRGTCFSMEWGDYSCSRSEFAFGAVVFWFLAIGLPMGLLVTPFWMFAVWCTWRRGRGDGQPSTDSMTLR